jgi:hypothetical protein
VTTHFPHAVLALLAAAVLVPATSQAQIPGLPAAAVDQPPRSSLPAPIGIDEIAPSTPARQEPAMRDDPAAGSLRAPVQGGIPDVGDRQGPTQTEDELVRTSLLNRFGGLGFSALGRLTREGELYVAEVMTRDRRWIEILIDPRTGEVLTPP